MKNIFKNKGIAYLCLAISMFLFSQPSSAILMLSHEGHHGDGGCVIETGDFPVVVSVYEVPEGNVPPMHSFCSHAPNTGKISVTIELSDQAQRELPIAVRVLMEGHDGGEGAHEVLYMPAEKYTSGVIVVGANIEHEGQYNIQLETNEADNTKTAVNIPLHVGGGGGHGDHGSGFGTMEIILLVAAVAAGAFVFTRRKKESETSDS